MDEKTINKTIYYGIGIVVIYHILGIFIPMLTWAVIVLIVYRIFLCQKPK